MASALEQLVFYYLVQPVLSNLIHGPIHGLDWIELIDIDWIGSFPNGLDSNKLQMDWISKIFLFFKFP